MVTPPSKQSDPAGPPDDSDAELQGRRENLRRGLRRANLASVSILAVVIALAAALVWKARESSRQAARALTSAQRANLEAGRAQRASERAEQELWNSRLNETRAERFSSRPGALIENQRRVIELAQRPGLTDEQRLALRQEAIAQMASMDIALPEQAATNKNHTALTWNAALDHYFWMRDDGAVDIVEHPSGKRVAELRGEIGARAHVAVFSPDGRSAAVRFHGGEVRVWNLATTNLLLTTRCVRVPNHSNPLLFSPDSRWLGMFTTSGFAIQALTNGSLPRILQPGRVIDGAAFAPRSNLLAALPMDNLNVVEVWNLADGTLKRRFDPGYPANGVEWHPDGRRLAVLGRHGQIALWETGPVAGSDAGFPRQSIEFSGHLGAIVYFQFTPDGTKLLTQSWDTTSRFWDVVSGRELFRETRLSLNGIGASGDRVVGITPDANSELICRIVETETGFKTFASAGRPRGAQGVWLSPDERLLAIGHPPEPNQSSGEIRLWDFKQRVELARLPGIWAQFSPDSRTLYAFDFGAVRRYDVDAAVLANPPDDWSVGHLFFKPDRGVRINTGQISPDGRTLTVAATDRVIQLDASSAQVTGGFKAMAHYVSPCPGDGRTITMFQNQPAILRDNASGREILGSGGFGHGLYSPDSNWLTLVEHDRVRLFHSPALELAWEAPLALGAMTPPPVAFSPDGRMLAVSHQRTDVLLHDVASGRVLAVFSPPNPSQITGAHGIEFGQDGRWLLIARNGGDVVGWDLEAVKTHLTRLNLGWDMPAINAAAPSLDHAPPAAADDAPQPWSTIETAIFVTTVATLLGGLFVFAIQRRLLRSYEHAESVASEQRRRLGSARSELLHGQKMRALGTLAAGIAHDFNNLLSVIRLSNQLAAEQTQPTGVAKENVDAIDSAVSQGETIVQSMLGYSRATAEKESVYAVDDAVNETVAMLGRKFLAGIILKLEIAEHLPAVRGSRSRLEQVLLNLIVNASEAMSGQGTLLVTVRATADPSGCVLAPRESRSYIEVTVGDSGPGIPPEVLSRIFEPFFTTKTLGTRPGTGLGLATVYTMAEQDGLGLAVSTAGGVGTTFRIFVAADAGTGSPDS